MEYKLNDPVKMGNPRESESYMDWGKVILRKYAEKRLFLIEKVAIRRITP